MDRWDKALTWPDGVRSDSLGLFDAVAALLAAALEVFGVQHPEATALGLLPPALALLTLGVLVWGLHRIGGALAALGGLLGFVAFGAHHRFVSQVGFGDHHTAEALCLSVVLVSLPLAQRTRTGRILLGAGLVAWPLTWRGAPLMVALLVLAIWLAGALRRAGSAPSDPPSCMAHALPLAVAGAVLGTLAGWCPSALPSPPSGAAAALLLAAAAALVALEPLTWRRLPHPSMLDLWALLVPALGLVTLAGLADLAGEGLLLLLRPKSVAVAEHAWTALAWGSPGATWAAGLVLVVGAMGAWSRPGHRVAAAWGLLVLALLAWSRDYAYLLGPLAAWGTGHAFLLAARLPATRVIMGALTLPLAAGLLLGTPGVDDALDRAATDGHLGPEPAWFQVLDRLPPGSEPVLTHWSLGPLVIARTGRPVFASGSSGRLLALAWSLPLLDRLPPPARSLARARYLVIDHAQATVRYLPEVESGLGVAQAVQLASNPDALVDAWRASRAVGLYRDHALGRSDLRLVDEAGPLRLVGLVRRSEEVVFLDRALPAESDVVAARAMVEAARGGAQALPGGEVLLEAAVRRSVRVFERVAGTHLQGHLAPGLDSAQVRARAILETLATGERHAVAWPGRIGEGGTWTVTVPVDGTELPVSLVPPVRVEVLDEAAGTWSVIAEVTPAAGSAASGSALHAGPLVVDEVDAVGTP